MTDLAIAYVTMLALAIALGALAAGWLYPRERNGLILAITLAMAATIAFMLYAAGQLYLARWVSDSAAIVWTNLTPLFAALGAGWVLRLPKVPKVRKLILSGLLAMGTLATLFWPSLATWLRPPPQGSANVVRSGVVMQTAWATCSPAAAATLLIHSGIETSENELIPLCLTDNAGTPSLGLYRGVKLLADRHDRQVIVLDSSIDELFARDQWPVLLTVELPETGVDDPRYAQEWGWIPGLGHSVVALQRLEGDKLLIGDPSVGQEVWSRQDLEVLWHGQGLQLAAE